MLSSPSQTPCINSSVVGSDWSSSSSSRGEGAGGAGEAGSQERGGSRGGGGMEGACFLVKVRGLWSLRAVPRGPFWFPTQGQLHRVRPVQLRRPHIQKVPMLVSMLCLHCLEILNFTQGSHTFISHWVPQILWLVSVLSQKRKMIKYELCPKALVRT